MKSHYGAIILEEQERYLESLLPKRDPLFEEMESYSKTHGIPSSDPEVLNFLGICIRSIRANTVLEIGTAIGYGAIGMARALQPGGKVTTIDPSPERTATARKLIERAGLADRIEIIRGMALDVLPTLHGPFDLAYIDALKEEYSDYLKLIVPLLRTGGVIIADNVLWKGQVATGRLLSPDQKASTEALQRFNRLFVTHPALQATIIPLGDGIAYGVKQ
jgi:predicted O-methyltransferase YrrM